MSRGGRGLFSLRPKVLCWRLCRLGALTLSMTTARGESCHAAGGLFSFQQRKPDSLRSHVCAPSAKNPSSLTRVFGTERKKWKRNAARHRWFLDLLRAISVCPKTGLNVALPLRLTRSAAHSYGNVEVPASTFLRKSGSAKRS